MGEPSNPILFSKGVAGILRRFFFLFKVHFAFGSNKKPSRTPVAQPPPRKRKKRKVKKSKEKKVEPNKRKVKKKLEVGPTALYPKGALL